ncbi:MAG: transcriptional repressor NrdR [Lachnospiraceae bacterium]|nr:transcriptional repressor NrdR [Lachnospiraceae bacterium]
MKCPFCNNENIRVIDSRPAEEHNAIRRRRQCEVCHRRFTTYEKIETIPLMVVKKDETRQAYDRDKIEAGVLLACHKRPIPAQDINCLVDEVENEAFSSEDKEITTRKIGNLVMDKLKELDEVAYVRFSSVYREFKDVNTFLKELEKLYKGRKE